MANSLSSRIALVTGASRGIGRAVAQRLASDGALVAVHYNTNSAAAAEVVAGIEAAGGAAFALGADLAVPADITALFAALDSELVARTGQARFDILVNNAGIGVAATLAETTEKHFDDLMATNVKGLFFVTQAAAGRIRDGGRIINMSSMCGLSAYPGCPVYAMTKAAVNSLTHSLAVDLGPRQITVNAVTPGPVETDFISGYLADPAVASALAAGSVLGRIGQPGDVADIVAFLASDDSRWVTGQIMRASGGMHL